MRSMVILLLSLLGAACATRAAVDFIPTNPPPRALAPRAPESIAVLRRDELQRPHVEIGLLASLHDAGTPAETMRRALRERAARAGCDAVVLLGDNEWIYRLTESGDTRTTRRRHGHRAVCVIYP
jgi:hypothetical protein